MHRVLKIGARIALLLMLSQFYSPAFLPIVVGEDEGLTFHLEFHSLVAVASLRENEETDTKKISEADEVCEDFIPHITDLTSLFNKRHSFHVFKSDYDPSIHYATHRILLI